ncbi:MAG: threonylcarbamoyl-AMP synthase [Firmicutes bacterium]|nr:threonylcarbamoyl-AMP synthase [Bacillota bacterium]
MQTRIYKVDPWAPDPIVIEEAAGLLASGEVVAFPTETVYGLGANGLDSRAVKKIFAAKGRPADNPLILHIAEPETLHEIVADIPERAQILIRRFWPGPLTMVLPKKPEIPSEVTAGLSTVAVRMPAHPVAKALIAAAGVPVAAPSANISGRPSPTRAEHVWEDLAGKIAAVVDGGQCGIGLESTVIDLSGEVPYLLRPGGITLEQLEAVLGRVEVAGEVAASQTPKAPGMKYRHYAPKAPLWIVNAETTTQTLSLLNRLVEEDLARNEKVAVIASAETVAALEEKARPGLILRSLGSRNEPAVAAQNLFAILREVDKAGADVIYAEAVGTAGIGAAVMNRLYKAAGGRVINPDPEPSERPGRAK